MWQEIEYVKEIATNLMKNVVANFNAQEMGANGNANLPGKRTVKKYGTRVIVMTDVVKA